MADYGIPDLSADGRGLRVAIVAATWHEEMMAGLIDGARRAVADSGADEPTLVRVAGSFELPLVCLQLARTHDVVIALGVIIRGGTPHFEYVAQGVTQGLMQVGLETRVPIGFGVLTCDNEAQARDRSGLSGAHESKGHEAGMAAVHAAATLRALAGHSLQE